jgi:hypothetical protein
MHARRLSFALRQRRTWEAGVPYPAEYTIRTLVVALVFG